MPIRNTAALDALKALSEGGSAGLSAYKAAQGKETASRTTALQGALGGNNVAEAAAQAQAKYSPKVDTSGLGVGQLGAAANNYLSQAANKLSAQQYEDDANLSLQAEALRRTAVSDKDRALMLQASADAMGAEQRSKLNAGGLTDLTGQRDSLRQQLTEFDQSQAPTSVAPTIPVMGDTKQAQDLMALLGVEGNESDKGRLYQQDLDALRASGRAQEVVGQQANPALAAEQARTAETGLLARAAAAGDPTAIAQVEAAKAQQAQQDQKRDEILRQMAGVDQEYARQAEQYAGALGTDAQGLLAQYHSGRQNNVNDILTALAPQQVKAERAITAGGQTRLRELAPAFGIDELTAAGMFREGASDDKDLTEFNRQQDEASFVEGATDAIDPEEYKVLSKVPGVRNEEIPSILGSDNWRGLEELTSDFVASGGKELAGGDGTKLTGIDGYREALLTAAQGATHPDGTPLEAREIQTLVNMMIAKHGTYVNKAFGKGEDSE